MNKKQVIKRIVQAVAFCAIFAIIFNCIYSALSWKDGKDIYVSASETLYEDLEENIVDVLFLGSSHCYCSINNSQLWNDYGMGSFSMVISGQDLASSYYSMRETLKTQTPQVVCVELFGCTFEKHAVVGNIYRNTLSWRYSDTFFDAVKTIAPEEDKKDFLLKWPIIHTRYKELQKQDFVSTSPAFLGHTFQSHATVLEEITPYTGEDVLPISAHNQEWIQKMVRLAKENNIQICFFIAPYPAGENVQKMFRYTQEYLENQGVSVVNMFDSLEQLELDVTTDFSDGDHTNSYGAKKVTAFMGEYLKANYSIPDRRGDERYALWEDDYKAFTHSEQNYDLTQRHNVSKYLNTLSTLEDYTVVISSNGNFTSEDVDISAELHRLGVDDDFIRNGGVRIITDGNIVYASKNKSYQYHTDLSQNVLEVRGESDINTIIIDRVDCKKVDDGLNIVVYDNYLGEIADVVGFMATKGYDSTR